MEVVTDRAVEPKAQVVLSLHLIQRWPTIDEGGEIVNDRRNIARVERLDLRSRYAIGERTEVVGDRHATLPPRFERDGPHTRHRVQDPPAWFREPANEEVPDRRLQLALVGAQRVERSAPIAAAERVLPMWRRLAELRCSLCQPVGRRQPRLNIKQTKLTHGSTLLKFRSTCSSGEPS